MFMKKSKSKFFKFLFKFLNINKYLYIKKITFHLNSKLFLNWVSYSIWFRMLQLFWRKKNSGFRHVSDLYVLYFSLSRFSWMFYRIFFMSVCFPLNKDKEFKCVKIILKNLTWLLKKELLKNLNISAKSKSN